MCNSCPHPKCAPPAVFTFAVNGNQDFTVSHAPNLAVIHAFSLFLTHINPSAKTVDSICRRIYIQSPTIFFATSPATILVQATNTLICCLCASEEPPLLWRRGASLWKNLSPSELDTRLARAFCWDNTLRFLLHSLEKTLGRKLAQWIVVREAPMMLYLPLHTTVSWGWQCVTWECPVLQPGTGQQRRWTVVPFPFGLPDVK